MANNVMQEYIKITQEEILTYMKLIFEKSYNKKIALRYMEAYENVRFYDFYKKDENLTFRKNFLNALKEAETKIKKQFPEKEKLVENMRAFYYYILYFDKISYKTDVEEKIEELYQLRKKLLKKDNEEFKNVFYKTFKLYSEQKQEYLDKFSTEDFYLKITDYEGMGGVYKVMLKYNINIPMIYSEKAIETVFNSGLIEEDKLYVEYNLISVEVISDILRGNFKKQYIIEFAPAVLKKNKKMKSLLNIIDNSAIQDKINLTINYEDFSKNKENIYELMRNGFKFAIVLDNTFEPEYGNFEKLKMFNYVILKKDINNYQKILQNENIIENLIKI